jgi:hypothetical protein
MARGVNTLLTRLRMRRCSGGSMKITEGTGGFSADRIISKSVPPADEYVRKSFSAVATSSWRDSA